MKTDKAISRGKTGPVAGRELQRWDPGQDDNLASLSLDELKTNTGKKWDQFEVNNRLFGVKSTYDENLYTTK